MNRDPLKFGREHFTAPLRCTTCWVMILNLFTCKHLSCISSQFLGKRHHHHPCHSLKKNLEACKILLKKRPVSTLFHRFTYIVSFFHPVKMGWYRYQIFNTGDTKVRLENIDTSQKYECFRYCTWPAHSLSHVRLTAEQESKTLGWRLGNDHCSVPVLWPVSATRVNSLITMSFKLSMSLIQFTILLTLL